MDVREYLRSQSLNLEARLVAHAVGPSQCGRLLLAQAAVQQAALLRQRLIARSCNLGQVQVAILPTDDVTCPRDLHSEAEIFPLDPARRNDIEQLGVNRAAVELKHQLAHARSKKFNVHDGSARWHPQNNR